MIRKMIAPDLPTPIRKVKGNVTRPGPPPAFLQL
jgi:hypothetical protein